MSVLRITSPDGTLQITWDDGDLVKALNRSAEGVRPAGTAGMHKAGKALTRQMAVNLVRHRKVASGRLFKALMTNQAYRLEGRRGLQTLVAAPHIGDPGVEVYEMEVELGRRPGAKMPPKGALLPWMAIRGIPEEAEFPIRRKIGEEGYRGQPHPFIDPAADQAGPLLDLIADEVMTSVVALIGGR